MNDKSLRAWLGSTQAQSDVLVAAPAQRLAALLGQHGLDSSELPPLWHWAYFLEAAPQSELGPDGHPRRGVFLPPVPLPRRMFAGGRMEFRAPLEVGAEATRRGVIKSIDQKEGRTGPLVFVTVRYEVAVGGRTAVVEERDLVYRDGSPSPSATSPLNRLHNPPHVPEDIPAAPWQDEFLADEVLLFRFSAVTFNAHRIHYDLPYAAGTEGYPGLVVQGPLVAIKLAELARRHARNATCTDFSFRAHRPLFAAEAISLRGWPHGREALLEAYSADGRLAMRAQGTFDRPFAEAERERT